MDIVNKLEAAADGRYPLSPELCRQASQTIQALRRWLRETEDAARKADQERAIRLDSEATL